MYTSPYEFVQYNVSGPLSTFVFNKCSEKNIFNIIFVVLRVLVGIVPARRRRRWRSITSALGQCIVISVFSGAGMESVIHIMQLSKNTVQSPNAVSMTGQRRELWVNIETALGE